MNVVIVSERERPSSEADKELLTQIIERLVKEHSSRLVIISVGCDQGVGKFVMTYCLEKNIKFAEIRIKFQGLDFPRKFFGTIFKARNMSLLELGDEYYVFLGTNPRGLIAEIVELAKEKVGPDRVQLFPYQVTRLTEESKV